MDESKPNEDRFRTNPFQTDSVSELVLFFRFRAASHALRA